MTFGENLVKARKEKGFSQEDLANRIGITRQSISKWENGDAMPDAGNIQQLAQALGVSLDALFGADMAKNEPPRAPVRVLGGKHILIGVLLLFLGLLAGFLLGRATAPVPELAAQFPENVTVSGVEFKHITGGAVRCECVPSVIREDYTYTIGIINRDFESKYIECEAQYSNGKFYADFPVSRGNYYVYLSVSDGQESRIAVLAEMLQVEDYGFRWQ